MTRVTIDEFARLREPEIEDEKKVYTGFSRKFRGQPLRFTCYNDRVFVVWRDLGDLLTPKSALVNLNKIHGFTSRDFKLLPLRTLHHGPGGQSTRLASLALVLKVLSGKPEFAPGISGSEPLYYWLLETFAGTHTVKARREVQKAIDLKVPEAEAWLRFYREDRDFAPVGAGPQSSETFPVPSGEDVPVAKGGSLQLGSNEVIQPGEDVPAALQEAPEGLDRLIFGAGDTEVSLAYDAANETVWATQNQIAEMLGRDRTTIGRHIAAVIEDGEIDPNSVCANFALTASDGKTYEIQHYSLDMILLVAFRTKQSALASKLRVWAMKMAKEQLLKQFKDDRWIEIGLSNGRSLRVQKESNLAPIGELISIIERRA